MISEEAWCCYGTHIYDPVGLLNSPKQGEVQSGVQSITDNGDGESLVKHVFRPIREGKRHGVATDFGALRHDVEGSVYEE